MWFGTVFRSPALIAAGLTTTADHVPQLSNHLAKLQNRFSSHWRIVMRDRCNAIFIETSAPFSMTRGLPPASSMRCWSI